MVVLVELLATVARVLWHVSLGIITSIFPFVVPKKDISGQLVLVTGAGHGIGALLAKKMANMGAKLVLWDVNAGWFFHAQKFRNYKVNHSIYLSVRESVTPLHRPLKKTLDFNLPMYNTRFFAGHIPLHQ